jgi:hypothetical protein
MAEQFKMKMDYPAVLKMTRSPIGPVGLRMKKSSEAIAARARALAPGTMKDHIDASVTPGITGLTATVSCDHPAATFVNQGTPPHIIRSHGSYPLRNKAKGQIFGPVVHHPGTQPNPFLEQAMREAGWRV